MKNILNILLIISLQSCIRDNPIIVVSNKSDKIIDSITTFPDLDNNTVFYNFKPNEKRKGIILMNNLLKNDGAYGISIYENGHIIKQKAFGYYTNGGSLDYGFNVIIENDTILIESPSFIF